MISRRNPEEGGFTIHELMVVLAVGSLLVGLGLSLFLFTSRSFGRWKERREVRLVVERIAESVATDIARSISVEELTASSFVLARPLGVRSSYIIQDDRIVRNGGALHGEDVKVQMTLEALEGVYLVRITGIGRSIRWTVERKSMPFLSGRSEFTRRRAV